MDFMILANFSQIHQAKLYLPYASSDLFSSGYILLHVRETECPRLDKKSFS